MTASYRVYIDESRDEGFRFLPDERGASRWFVVSAVVLRKSNDLAVVQLMRDVRALLGKDPKAALHFRHLKHEQRLPFARAIGAARLRTVSVLIHKPSITEPDRFQDEAWRLYRYATRLLLERVSWLCRDHRKQEDGDGTAELVFSNRSAMSYDALRDYLRLLRDRSEAQDVRIDWQVVDPDRVQAVNHEQLAGLQVADAVASGAFYAVNLTQYLEAEARYLQLMAPKIYRHKGEALGYGLKFWPASLDALSKTLEHLAAIERL